MCSLRNGWFWAFEFTKVPWELHVNAKLCRDSSGIGVFERNTFVRVVCEMRCAAGDIREEQACWKWRK